MKTQITDVVSSKQIDAIVEKATKKDMPIKKNGWQFTWRSLHKTEGSEFYKLVIEKNEEIQGMLMLSLMNDEMLYMNNIEVAPHNFGAKGKYENVAGCLIAYGCLKSFELGQDHYKGYLTFESKTKLISLYEKKYNATLVVGQRMFIEPKEGLKLIEKYLNQKL